MIYKTTTCESIIAKVIMDFEPQSNNWKTDAPEWIGEGLAAIGHSAGFEKVSKVIKIKGHMGAFPCDMIDLKLVEYGNQPLSIGTSIRNGNYRPIISSQGLIKTEFPLVDLETEETIVLAEKNQNWTQGQYCEINPDFIQTSFEEGYIRIYYTRYKIGSDGYPAVPDTYAHREALAFYILYKWLGRGNKHIVWDVRSAYDMWAGDPRMGRSGLRDKARNKAIFPSIQQLDSFTNMWVRIVADRSLPSTSFFTGNISQQISGV